MPPNFVFAPAVAGWEFDGGGGSSTTNVLGVPAPATDTDTDTEADADSAVQFSSTQYTVHIATAKARMNFG